MSKSTARNLLILQYLLIGISLIINTIAIYLHIWNFLIGQSLIICPAMTYITYLNYKRIRE